MSEGEFVKSIHLIEKRLPRMASLEQAFLPILEQAKTEFPEYEVIDTAVDGDGDEQNVYGYDAHKIQEWAAKWLGIKHE